MDDWHESVVLLDVPPGDAGEFDRAALERMGHPVLVCHGPSTEAPCPLLGGRGCPTFEQAHGIVFKLDLGRDQSFFETVHHLKDWLGNDQSIGVAKADGAALITSSPVLQLCADLANGSKHLTLTGSRTGDPSTTIARNDVTVFLGTGATKTHRFYVASGGTEHDVLTIAEDAVDVWTTFLHSGGLV